MMEEDKPKNSEELTGSQTGSPSNGQLKEPAKADRGLPLYYLGLLIILIAGSSYYLFFGSSPDNGFDTGREKILEGKNSINDEAFNQVTTSSLGSAATNDQKSTIVAPQVSVQLVKELLDKGEKLVMLDVRSREAFDREHIEGSKNIFFPEIPQRYRELDKEDTLIVYCVCSNNNEAVEASRYLITLGFQKIWIMDQGLTSWKKLGYPTVKA